LESGKINKNTVYETKHLVNNLLFFLTINTKYIYVNKELQILRKTNFLYFVDSPRYWLL